MLKFKNKFLWAFFILFCLLYICIQFITFTTIYGFNSNLDTNIILYVIILPTILLFFFQWLVWNYADIQNRIRVKKLFVIIFVIGISPTVYWLSVVGMNEYKSHFNHERWVNVNNVNERVYMIDDLRKEYSLKGMSKNELIQLLGKETKTNHFKKPNNMVYYLGSDSEIDTDQWFVIEFDRNDKVVRFTVQMY